LSYSPLINTATREIWELKPITHSRNAVQTAADKGQVAGYIATIATTGQLYRPGNPSDLVNYQEGGVLAGTFFSPGLTGKEYEVRLYPGEVGSGLFYYALKETGRTRMDEIGDKVSKTLKDIARELAKQQCCLPGPRGPRDPVPE
jgi:hypothetical protein